MQLESNMMNTFVTHPSIRIKGTENNYNPMQCYDRLCENNKTPHSHCPFCIKADIYQDPVILKAHYRVKHVDKGIDFAGLKVLRCCDHCDIVGIIKGEKKFKGAHWHCYRCRNGFNRRDEALKHYKTHFRNPHTTFQIQVTQDINHPLSLNGTSEVHCATEGLTLVNETTGVTSVPPGGIIATVEDGFIHTSKADNTVHVSVAANETIESISDDNGRTIMILRDTSQDDTCFSAPIVSMDTNEDVLEEQNSLEIKYEELLEKYHKLEVEKLSSEERLTKEIESLNSLVSNQASEIETLKKSEQKYLEQLSVPIDNDIQALLGRLQHEHNELIERQLSLLKRTYVAELVSSTVKTISGNTRQNANTKYDAEIIFEKTDASVSEEPNVVADLAGNSSIEVLSAHASPGPPAGAHSSQEAHAMGVIMTVHSETCEESNTGNNSGDNEHSCTSGEGDNSSQGYISIGADSCSDSQSKEDINASRIIVVSSMVNDSPPPAKKVKL